jgi:hypothetical protein
VSAEVAGGAGAVLLGAKLDVVARRGEIGDDLVAWLRRPGPAPADADPGDPAPGQDVPDLVAELFDHGEATDESRGAGPGK